MLMKKQEKKLGPLLPFDKNPPHKGSMVTTPLQLNRHQAIAECPVSSMDHSSSAGPLNILKGLCMYNEDMLLQSKSL